MICDKITVKKKRCFIMPLHLGMPTLLESPSLEQSLKICCDLGLDFVELNMNLPEHQLDAIDVPLAIKMIADTGKYLTVHLDENLNVCDFNPAIADAYLTTVLRTIELAKEINAPIINMHMAAGVHFTLPDRKVFLFEHHQGWYLDRLRFFRDACDTAIGESGVTICIENCGAYHGFQQKGIDLLLESRKIALTYDVGHDHCAGYANEAFILNRPDRIKHIHLHDAKGEDNHLPLGDGEIDLQGKLPLIEKQDARCVLEIKTISGLRKSVEYVNDNWRTTKHRVY